MTGIQVYVKTSADASFTFDRMRVGKATKSKAKGTYRQLYWFIDDDWKAISSAAIKTDLANCQGSQGCFLVSEETGT